MKKLILSMIFTGAAITSLVIVTSIGCGSPDQLGKGETTSGGGTAGTPSYKLDGSVTSQGGSGGKGSSSAPPTGDASCGQQTVNTTREPPDVMLVLDCSSSMAWSIAQDNCYCTEADAAFSNAGSMGGTALCTNTTDCSSRWSAVAPAVINTVSNSKDVQWGLKLFPTPGASSQCTVSTAMETPIAADSAAAIADQVQKATLSLSTPTAATLKAATAYLKTLTDNRPKAILLATDGEPNCGGSRPSISVDDINGATQAAAEALKAGFPVYVVGIGPNPGNLSQLAKSGGTNDYYPASSPDQLLQAFADIKTAVASCTFTLEKQPGADLTNVGVYIDKKLVEKDPTNGWSFGAGNKTVVLNGSACDQITSGKASGVELYFGCPGQPPPPAIP